jgi:hypothetical protein
VNVHQVRLEGIENFPYRKLAVVSRDNARHQGKALEPGELFKLVIAPLVTRDFVPVLLQQAAFLLEDDVFSAGLLVRVVDKQDFHFGVKSASADRGTPDDRAGLTSGTPKGMWSPASEQSG